MRGALPDVALEVKRRIEANPISAPILVFDDRTGRQTDFNLQGSDEDVVRRLSASATPTEMEALTVKQAQERTYKVMLVLAGNLEGFEEALRVLYRRDRAAFMDRIKGWPEDLRHHLAELAEPVFAENTSLS